MSYWWPHEEELGFKEDHVEPLVEVRETEKEIIVMVDLPFVERKEDVNVSLHGSDLEITATMCRVIKWEKWGTYQRHKSYSQYKTRIKLPSEVDHGKARAIFRNGILKIVLPKKVTRVKIEVE
jgi:HSP20 family protein